MDEFGSCLAVVLSEDEDAADESLFCCFPDDDDDGTQLLLFFDFHNFILISSDWIHLLDTILIFIHGIDIATHRMVTGTSID